MDTHPGIVIPVNITPEPSVQPQRITPLPPNRQTRPPPQLQINPNYSFDLPTADPQIDPLSSPTLAMRRMQADVDKPEAIAYRAMVIRLNSRRHRTATFSDMTPKTEFPIQAKPSSPTVAIARRKDSGTYPQNPRRPSQKPLQNVTQHDRKTLPSQTK